MLRRRAGKHSRSLTVTIVVLVAVSAAGAGSAAAGGDRAGVTTRVSVSSAEAQGNQGSGGASVPAISPNGRYVAFTATASNLVPGDTNDTFDVFVRDRAAGTTRRVSVSSNEAQANSYSEQEPAFSADGRYVTFTSDSANLVPGDTNSNPDVFVRDRAAGTTRRVSVSSNETQGNSLSSGQGISAGGGYVAFTSLASNLVRGDTNGSLDVFVRDLRAGTTRQVSVSSNGAQGDGISAGWAISADGRQVAFYSEASNLVPADTNGFPDVFVRVLTR